MLKLFLSRQRFRISIRTMSHSSHIFTAQGVKVSKPDLMKQVSDFKGQVLLLGENHMDSHAHHLELEVLKSVAAAVPKKKWALSLEFYDREAQVVLDEYLAGHVTKETFLEDSRPPANHEDYQSLLEYCKELKVPVIASNCPRRYTRLVNKTGKDALLQLVRDAPDAQKLLPKLPYPSASEKYRSNFLSIMGQIGNTNPNVATSMLDAQSLWDATMADSIVKALEIHDLVVHVSGYFHVQQGLGLCEHLRSLRPEVTIQTVVMLPEETPSAFNPESHSDLGDFVVLTPLES